MEEELFDTGVLKNEETSNKPTISTFVPPNLETRLGTVPAVTIYRSQSSSEPGQTTDVQDRSGNCSMSFYHLFIRKKGLNLPLPQMMEIAILS